jgi:hypothetical protein
MAEIRALNSISMYQVAGQIKLQLDDCTPLVYLFNITGKVIFLCKDLTGFGCTRNFKENWQVLPLRGGAGQAKEERIPLLGTAMIQSYRTHDLELVVIVKVNRARNGAKGNI